VKLHGKESAGKKVIKIKDACNVGRKDPPLA
jgi:hypothetical protein